MAIYVYFADFLNCSARDIDCLRNKSIDEIVNAQMKAEQEVSSLKLLQFFEPWVPWLDGKIIKGELLEIEKWIGNESFPLKPIILGSMTEECVNYIFEAWQKPVPTKEYIAVITAALKEYAPLLLTKYPPEKNTTDQRNLMTVFATRWVFSCSSRQFFETYITNSKSGENDNYLYVFDFPFDFPGWGNDTFCIGHTCHGGDMPYTFDIPDANFTDVGHQIALQHIQYWSNFAKNQSPNSNETISGDSLLYWPKYDTINRNNLRFKAPKNIIEAKYLEKECDFLDSIGYYH
jgi:carboxylesterase type B